MIVGRTTGDGGKILGPEVIGEPAEEIFDRGEERLFISTAPILMPHRQAVEDVAVKPPLGYELIHHSDKAGVVRRLEQMDHFVHDDVLEAFLGLFCEFRIQADGAGSRVAAAPFGLHLLHKKSVHRNRKPRLPNFDQGRKGALEEVSIPACNHRPPCLVIGAGADTEKYGVMLHFHTGGDIFLHHLQ